MDPELEMMYEKDKGPTMLMTKHVDDLKIGGLPPRPEQVLQKIEKGFRTNGTTQRTIHQLWCSSTTTPEWGY